MTNPGSANEDCLLLDIYVPVRNETDPDKFPVLVYFHGGALVFGSSKIPLSRMIVFCKGWVCPKMELKYTKRNALKTAFYFSDWKMDCVKCIDKVFQWANNEIVSRSSLNSRFPVTSILTFAQWCCAMVPISANKLVRIIYSTQLE